MENAIANRDPFGGIAVDSGSDSFGGIPVENTDQFGGVAVAESPKVKRTPAEIQARKDRITDAGTYPTDVDETLGMLHDPIEYLANLPKTLVNIPIKVGNYVASGGSETATPIRKPLERGEPLLPELLKPLPELQKDIEGITQSRLGKAIFTPEAGGQIAGAMKAGEDFGRGLTAPEVLPTLGAGGLTKSAVAKVAPLVFAAQMAHGIPETASEAGRLSVEGTPAEATRANIGLGAQIALPAMIGSHAARGLVKDNPFPEHPATTAAQLDMLQQGKRDAVLITPGESMPPVPEGFAAHETPAGTFIFNPETLTPEHLNQSVADNRIGDVLGYGIPAKPAPQDIIGAVVVRGADGTEKHAVMTDQAHLDAVMDQAKKMAGPGDTVAMEHPADVVAARGAPVGPEPGEVPVAAAIRVNKTGEVFTGSFHPEAYMKAVEAGKVDSPTDVDMNLFQTSKGRLIDRDTAERWYGQREATAMGKQFPLDQVEAKTPPVVAGESAPVIAPPEKVSVSEAQPGVAAPEPSALQPNKAQVDQTVKKGVEPYAIGTEQQPGSHEPKHPGTGQGGTPVAPSNSNRVLGQTEGNGPARVKIAGSPQTYQVVERLPASEVELANGEQPVRIRNERTGELQTVLENQLQAVKGGAPRKRVTTAQLDEQLRAAGMDPSSFPNAVSKRDALRRAGEKGPGMVGMGAAMENEFGSPPQARAAAANIEVSPPAEGGPLGTESTTSNSAKSVLREIQLFLKGAAGDSMPRTTAADQSTGEAGVRYASSRMAAKPLAQTFSAQTLEGSGLNPVQFGAALTEDNLRSVREWMKAEAVRLQTEGDTKASEAMEASSKKVASIIGSKGSPFQTEEAYQDYLQKPEVKDAVARHIQQWNETIDPMYKQAREIDPDVELPTRGLQTGARVNLKVIFENEDVPTHPVQSGSGPSLIGTFKRRTPFAARAKGTGEIYEVYYPEIISNTFEKQLEIANKNAFDHSLVESGLAEVHEPGWQGQVGGEQAVPFPLKRGVRQIVTRSGETVSVPMAQNLYIKKSLAPEYRAASNVVPRMTIPGMTKFFGLLNKTALAGLTDFTVHTSNLATALFNRPVSGPLLRDTLASTFGRADVPITLIKAILKAGKKNDAQWAELMRIGAGREKGPNENFTGRILKHMDRTTRLLLDDTYQQLVEDGLVKPSETGRREFVNQVGQYNRRLQGQITTALRDSGLGPFVTAGKTFNAMGIRMAAFDPRVEAANTHAATMLRANVLSKFIGVAVFAGMMNYLLTGKMTGRPGTQLGRIDTGLDDKNKKPLTFPFADVVGVGRAYRVTGLRGFIEAKRMGLTTQNAFDSAARDISNAAIGPAAGPPVHFGMVAATGYPPAVSVGRASPVAVPGQSQTAENVKEAVLEANPVLASATDVARGKSISEALSRQLPRFTLTPGKPPEMVEKYPKIVSLAQTYAYADYVVGVARKLEPEARAKFIRESLAPLTPDQKKMVSDTLKRRKVTAP